MALSDRDIERLNIMTPAANDIGLGDIIKSLQESEGGATSVTWANVTGKPSTFPPAAHTHTAAQISDASAVGRSVITAADASAARTAIGAGTSSLALGTTASTAAAGNHTHAASAITTAAITGVTGTNVQAVLAELAGRITALEGAGS
ncbi:hypothetical protein P4H42_03490 [Paenibacillus macerans]|uniref:hypothetical protein n=1 Tax=Paenibacillus macerans TaxID=44252 RepID=UPI002DB7A735|nr:hypothetical protein [Paenibacillus macerans]MEC0328685.1 hypothetical protein [Paenibacillus macerans]